SRSFSAMRPESASWAAGSSLVGPILPISRFCGALPGTTTLIWTSLILALRRSWAPARVPVAASRTTPRPRPSPIARLLRITCFLQERAIATDFVDPVVAVVGPVDLAATEVDLHGPAAAGALALHHRAALAERLGLGEQTLLLGELDLEDHLGGLDLEV